MTVDIRVPEWATNIKDEGILTFLAFVLRITETYGQEDAYTIALEDMVKICNKRADGLVNWLRSFPEIDDNILFGEPLDKVVIFKYKREQPRAGTIGRSYHMQGYETVQLHDTRQHMVWMYLLGCLNNNILTENRDDRTAFKSNAFGIKWFKLTREAMAYVKKKDRICEDEN